jgi:hypothetical protein
MSVDEMEAENVMLKERVKEMEYALIPPPFKWRGGGSGIE